jgi:hypothetical protein
LNPIILYYYQDNVKETLDRVKAERSAEWLDFSIFYYTQQTYRENRNLKGIQGVITFLENRKQVELEILTSLTIDKLILNNSTYGWDARNKEVKEFLETRIK